jgi:hypothetical protein
MSDEQPGALARPDILLAFPLAGGRWLLQPGRAEWVEGSCQTVSSPGLEARAGGHGLSVTFHVADYLSGEAPGLRANIRKVVIEGGRMASSDVVARAAEVVVGHSDALSLTRPDEEW